MHLFPSLLFPFHLRVHIDDRVLFNLPLGNGITFYDERTTFRLRETRTIFMNLCHVLPATGLAYFSFHWHEPKATNMTKTNFFHKLQSTL